MAPLVYALQRVTQKCQLAVTFYRTGKGRWNPAAGPLPCQILALAFLTKFFSDLMKYGADVLEKWNNIPSVAEVHLAGIFEKL